MLRIESKYQWYRQYGQWQYEPIKITRRVADGTIGVTPDQPGHIEVPVTWGRYRLEVENLQGPLTTYGFDSGWYAEASADTPDLLEIALDKSGYVSGDTMTVAVTARTAGKVTLSVIGDRLLTTTTTDVEAGLVKLPITVGKDWGTGAYVLATLRRPLDVAEKRMPGRAIGVQWFSVDKAEHTIGVDLDLPELIRPETTLRVPVKLAGLAPGAQARIVVSAVDVGILNLTGYEPPAPDDYYLGQRKLSSEVRDLYGQLIDGMQGTRGQIRTGGDSGAGVLQGSPPTQPPLALYSGIVTVGPDGTAEVEFAIPAFTGTVRVMAVAWSDDKVGHSSGDVVVRDPVVVTTTLPRFLLSGDVSTLRLDLDNVEGATGKYEIAISTEGPLSVKDADRSIQLDAKKRGAVTFPISALGVGDGSVEVAVTGPDDFAVSRQYALTVNPATQILARRTVTPLEPGKSITLTNDVFANLVPGTGSVALSVTPSAALDVASLLAALDRYPLGCTEQIVSRALPLLYVNEMALDAQLAVDSNIDERITKGIEIVLARQGYEGAFGLWSPGGDDPWLDSYVTDFLTRARARGFDVPDDRFKLALNRLRNYVSTAPDVSTDGGLALSYSLYVLARNGMAPVGDLRYIADVKLAALGTPTAQAEIGAALAMLGDKVRAETAFRAAAGALPEDTDPLIGRADFGSRLRDAAAVVTLAAEGDAPKVILTSATKQIDKARDRVTYTSTQEDAWLVLAARALGKQDVSLAVEEGSGGGRRSGRAALPHAERGGSRHQSADRDQCRRQHARRGDLGKRRADHAGAGHRPRLQARTHVPHARRRRDRHHHGDAESAHRGAADGHRTAAAIRPRGAHRLRAGGLRDRQSRARVVGRYWRAQLDHARGGPGAYGVPRQSLRGGVRAPGRQQAALHRGLRGARRVARQLRVAASRGGGHVPPRPLRPHRHRHCQGDPAEMSTLGRRTAYAAVGAVWIAAAAAGAAVGLVQSYGPVPRGQDLEVSTTVLDRNGRLLRAYLTDEGRWRLPATRDDVDPRFLEALLAYEDKRFFSHHGVDPLAMMRAAYQLASQGHIVSGGSTLTMQVARLLEPRRERSVSAKLRQTIRALQLEWALSKDEILRLYLTLAPYGGNLEGIRAASLAYFGKEPRRLTLGEAALLVALPQSPEYRRPDRYADNARAARDRVLDRIARDGAFSPAEIARAKTEPVPNARKAMPLSAPHAADEAMTALRGQKAIRLTIDGSLQRRLERLARERSTALGAAMSAAIVVVDNDTGEILARVASPDYFDASRAGQVDLTRAIRSPGSALKPFIYGLGFEDGLVHPETLIEDRPIRYGDYAPENFDLTFQGTVTVRRALQLSLNVPAVAVLDAVGPSRLLARLSEAGASLVLPKHETAGLALGLGGIGVRLIDLTALYSGLARQGNVLPLHERLGTPPAPDQTSFGAGGRLVCGRCAARCAAARERAGRAYRLQDRHELRLSRCLGGRFRRRAYDRGLGRAAGRRAGHRARGADRRGADPIRRLCPARAPPKSPAAGAQGDCRRKHGQAAATAQAVWRARHRRHGGAKGAYRVPAARGEPGARLGRHGARPHRHQDHRRHAAAQRAYQWAAVSDHQRAAHNILRARRTGLRAAHGHGRCRHGR